MFNQVKFKMKLLELGLTMKDIASFLGINEITLYRKCNNNGSFSRNELTLLKVLLKLSEKEFNDIFFAAELTETQE